MELSWADPLSCQPPETGDGTVTLAQFRDEVQTSRKFALSLLEYFDRSGFTRKLGDSRVIR